MQVKHLTHFEEQMRQSRGVKRGEMCKLLGISQAKWRRHIEDQDPEAEVADRTLGLAMCAVWAGLAPYGPETTFTKLAQQPIAASGPTAARINHQVHFVTWPTGGTVE